jgi:thymidylate synthase
MNASATRLAGATKELWNHWLQTREVWRDAKSHEFEQRYLAELQAGVEKALASIEQLDKLLTRIRKDCE